MIVDDSVVIRGMIARWIDEDDQLEIVAKCSNGQIAVDSMETARPDVIVLDIEMPVMDGLTALPKLLAARPKPRVIVASTLTKRNAAISLKALSLGATECLPKPDSNRGITTSTDFRRELLAKVRALGGLDHGVRPARTGRPRPSAPAERSRPVPKKPRSITAREPKAQSSAAEDFDLVPFNRSSLPKVLAIGSSTGGPQALTAVLKSVGGAFSRMPTLITQHMPPTFTAMLAENLERSIGRPCKEAEDGEAAKPGVTYIAPGGKHLLIAREGTDIVMRHNDGPQVNFTKPSVDVMFESIVKVYGSGVLAVILTGMGHDGADGVKLVRNAGGNIIAQDEASSVVWGMPGAAAHTGLCSAVLPLDEIGPRLSRIVAGGGA